MRFLFISWQVNLILGTIALAIALSGRFLFSIQTDMVGYFTSVPGVVSLVLLFTVLPTLLYRRFAGAYENASALKVSQIDKSVLFLAVWSAAVILLFFAASEHAKIASLGYLGLCIVGFIRLFAIVRRKEDS